MPLGVRSIVCRQAVELVTAYIEGTLSRRERRRFEAHIAQCPHCHEYLAQMRATIALAGTVKEEDLGPEARQDLITLYRRWKADGQTDGPADD
jgi:anti-sigma factor RsiW